MNRSHKGWLLYKLKKGKMDNIFIEPKKNDGNNAPFGPLGEIVDTRTYRRSRPEGREDVAARNARVVNYNCSLAIGMQSMDSLQEEADLMYSMLNELKVWPSGRTAWVGGTTVAQTHPMSQFNCSYVAINRLEAFTDLFELLMVGAGAGFRVHNSDISKLPEIRNIPNVSFKDYYSKDKKGRITQTEVTMDNDIRVIRVGDSRQGWIDSLTALFQVVFTDSDVSKVEYDFDSVRPSGERIKGFGGTASGPYALKGIIEDVLKIIAECPQSEGTSHKKLRSIDCMDISCAIAKGVVAGSARRSALICLFEEGDTLCAQAKKGLYTDPSKAGKMYRSQSNNTENIGTLQPERVKQFLLTNPDVNISDEKVKTFLKSGAPSISDLTPKFESVKSEGEPAFDNWERMIILRYCAARTWRPQYSPEEIFDNFCNIGTNPLICEAA